MHHTKEIIHFLNDAFFTALTFSKLRCVLVVWLAQVHQEGGDVSTDGHCKHERGADPERS